MGDREGTRESLSVGKIALGVPEVGGKVLHKSKSFNIFVFKDESNPTEPQLCTNS